nr:TetR/AcrR family transcriptional regulator [Kineosporia babensis]
MAAEHGIEHVTVEAISEAAGVSERTFFNYFATKDDAILGDPAEDIARICEQIRSAPAELTALQALYQALHGEVEEIRHHPELFTLRMAVLERTPSLFPRMMAGGESVIRDLTHAIAERVAVPCDHPFPALLALTGACTLHSTMVRWHSAGGPGDPQMLLSEAFDLLRNGFPDPVTTTGKDAEPGT